MRLTILCAPGSDPGDARTRATAVVDVRDAAGIGDAAAASSDPYVLVLRADARALPGAFGGLTAALDAGPGVVGGATHAAGVRTFGWMLAPAPFGPLPFELVPVVAGAAERGVDAAVRGPIDVAAPDMFVARRELLLEPLPDEPVAAMLELCARARDAGRDVVCRPALACETAPSADDRGRFAALRSVAERRPGLTGAHRLVAGMRRSGIDRQARVAAGRYGHVRVALPALTAIVHGSGSDLARARLRGALPPGATVIASADPAAALRDAMRVRGDRYVLVAAAGAVPDADGFDRLVTQMEEARYVAVAAPDATALDGTCVLLAAGRFPQHVEAQGATIAAAIASLLDAAAGLRLAVRAPGHVPPPVAPHARPRVTAVFLAASLPEITRMSLDALLGALRGGDEVVAVAGEHAATVHRLLSAYPQVRIEADNVDPLLGVAANRALASIATELVLLVADDVLPAPGVLDRLRAAFDRMPALGAAFPAIPGAPGGEGVLDSTYADLAQMRIVAEERGRARAHELEPIDFAVTPLLLASRAALETVGGIDPSFGPTRRGIGDLVVRLRAAGYGVVRCDDALAHRFDPTASRNPAAASDANQPVPAPPEAARLARGFDPATRVDFTSAAPPPRGESTLALAVPIADAAELERAAHFVAAAAAAYDARSPVRVHVLLDGEVSAAEAVARLRPVLAARGLPLEETIAVRVERAADLGAWVDALEAGVRAVAPAGHGRAALDGLAVVNASNVGSQLAAATR